MLYIRCRLLFIVLKISWLTRVSSHMNSSNNLLLHQRIKSCPIDGIPVCGMRDKQFVLFSNGCLLTEANKDILTSDTVFREVPLHFCMTGCDFSCEEIYKPVCARNKKTYQKKLFRNQCELLKYVCKTNMVSEWRIINSDMCPEDYSKVRRRKDATTEQHSMEKYSYHNNLYNPFGYNGNNYVNTNNELNVSPNDLYVYMSPPAFQTQFLDTDVASYQHSIPEHKTYDEIFNKIATFSPADISFHTKEDKTGIENQMFEHSTITPLPFVLNRMNLHYLPHQSLSHEINEESIARTAIDSFNVEGKKEYYYDFTKIEPSMRNQHIEVIRTPKTTEISETIPATTTSLKGFNEQEHTRVTMPNIECKFGAVAICAALDDGTLRTFETICEMMTTNVYFKKTWSKLHDGACENCERNCSRDYQPVCVARNGINYTMVNDCSYNKAVCLDKKSDWQKISNSECACYTRIPHKYVNLNPGFPYTSNHFASQTTAMPITEESRGPLTSEALKEKININQKHTPNAKRAITENFNSHDSGSESDCNKCEHCEETSEIPIVAESHIMRLINKREEKKNDES